MIPADDEPSENPPRWPWLDRWFEPPWRAFVTWVVLAGLMGGALDHGGQDVVANMVESLLDRVQGVLPTPLFLPIRRVALMSNILLLMFWFEPLALRLNRFRGLVWLGLRIVPFLVVQPFVNYDYALIDTLIALVSSALAALLLRGARTRPWMAMVAGALAASFVFVVESSDFQTGFWLWPSAMSLPSAAVLLFGTRRLPR